MTTAFGYIRVSTEEQADSGLGLEAQRERIRAYAMMKGLTLTDIYEDAGVSGGKPLASRPAGAKLLAAAKKGKAVVVAAKMDRLFRSVADAATTIDDFDKKGIGLVAVAEGFDMTSIYGKAMAQMASVFAELERGMIRERTKAGMAVKIKRQERVSRTKFGFDLTEDGKTFLPNPTEQEAIALMKELRAEGRSYQFIATELEARGIATKENGKWQPMTVRNIIQRAA